MTQQPEPSLQHSLDAVYLATRIGCALNTVINTVTLLDTYNVMFDCADDMPTNTLVSYLDHMVVDLTLLLQGITSEMDDTTLTVKESVVTTDFLNQLLELHATLNLRNVVTALTTYDATSKERILACCLSAQEFLTLPPSVVAHHDSQDTNALNLKDALTNTGTSTTRLHPTDRTHKEQ